MAKNEDLFYFLEQSPYFYERKEHFIAEPGGVKKNNRIVYTYYTQENPCKVLAEISIPVEDPKSDVEWKYIQFNENSDKPIYQADKNHIHYIPSWFRNLLLKAIDIYDDSVLLLRLFA